jgi:uncharacterized protein
MPPDRPRPLRFVIDTNIAISALLWGGQPRMLLQLADDPTVLQLFSSPVLLEELQRVLDYPKFRPRIEATGANAISLLFAFRSIVTLVEPAMVPKVVERDPDDNHVVAAALAVQADAIVSGDDDLLALGDAAGLPVLRVAEALALFV